MKSVLTLVLKQIGSRTGLTIALLLGVIALCLGCGGGIRGTGGVEPTQISGRLIDLNGTGVEGAAIRVLESGDEVISGPEGEFSLDTELPTGELSFAIQAGDVDATVSVGAVPTTLSSVTVLLEVDDSQNSVTVISTNIPTAVVPTAIPEPRDTPAISTPTPQVPSGETPTTPSPDATPTPFATPTATPAPTLQPNIYRGVMRHAAGHNITNGLVTIVNTGDSDISDSNGNFYISTEPVSGEITIGIGYRNPPASVVIPNIPSGGGFVIEMVVIVDEVPQNGVPVFTVTLESVNIR